MNIQHHIKALLYRHDCVIVKGLGGFVCQHKSAQIKNNYFFPPKKILSFNSSLKQEDGLLVNRVAKVEKVSFQIAQQKIKAFSQKLLETLEEEKEVCLSEIGCFTQNADHKLVFEPDNKNDWLTEAYGLPKFEVSKIEHTMAEPVLEKVKPRPKVVTLKENSSKPNYWKYAAVGIIAIGLAGLVGSQLYQKDVKAYNIAEQQKANQIVNQKIQHSSFIIEKPLKALSIEVKSNTIGKYHIVGGAFRVRSNVDKKIKQLKKQGFDAQYIGANAYGLHQVTYASFEDKNKALKKLSQIKAKYNSYAWLYVKEL